MLAPPLRSSHGRSPRDSTLVEPDQQLHEGLVQPEARTDVLTSAREREDISPVAAMRPDVEHLGDPGTRPRRRVILRECAAEAFVLVLHRCERPVVHLPGERIVQIGVLDLRTLPSEEHDEEHPSDALPERTLRPRRRDDLHEVDRGEGDRLAREEGRLISAHHASQHPFLESRSKSGRLRIDEPSDGHAREILRRRCDLGREPLTKGRDADASMVVHYPLELADQHDIRLALSHCASAHALEYSHRW